MKGPFTPEPVVRRLPFDDPGDSHPQTVTDGSGIVPRGEGDEDRFHHTRGSLVDTPVETDPSPSTRGLPTPSSLPSTGPPTSPTRRHTPFSTDGPREVGRFSTWSRSRSERDDHLAYTPYRLGVRRLL